MTSIKFCIYYFALIMVLSSPAFSQDSTWEELNLQNARFYCETPGTHINSMKFVNPVEGERGWKVLDIGLTGFSAYEGIYNQPDSNNVLCYIKFAVRRTSGYQITAAGSNAHVYFNSNRRGTAGFTVKLDNDGIGQGVYVHGFKERASGRSAVFESREEIECIPNLPQDGDVTITLWAGADAYGGTAFLNRRMLEYGLVNVPVHKQGSLDRRA